MTGGTIDTAPVEAPNNSKHDMVNLLEVCGGQTSISSLNDRLNGV